MPVNADYDGYGDEDGDGRAQLVGGAQMSQGRGAGGGRGGEEDVEEMDGTWVCFGDETFASLAKSIHVASKSEPIVYSVPSIQQCLRALETLSVTSHRYVFVSRNQDLPIVEDSVAKFYHEAGARMGRYGVLINYGLIAEGCSYDNIVEYCLEGLSFSNTIEQDMLTGVTRDDYPWLYERVRLVRDPTRQMILRNPRYVCDYAMISVFGSVDRSDLPRERNKMFRNFKFDIETMCILSALRRNSPGVEFSIEEIYDLHPVAVQRELANYYNDCVHYNVGQTMTGRPYAFVHYPDFAIKELEIIRENTVCLMNNDQQAINTDFVDNDLYLGDGDAVVTAEVQTKYVQWLEGDASHLIGPIARLCALEPGDGTLEAVKKYAGPLAIADRPHNEEDIAAAADKGDADDGAGVGAPSQVDLSLSEALRRSRISQGESRDGEMEMPPPLPGADMDLSGILVPGAAARSLAAGIVPPPRSASMRPMTYEEGAAVVRQKVQTKRNKRRQSSRDRNIGVGKMTAEAVTMVAEVIERVCGRVEARRDDDNNSGSPALLMSAAQLQEEREKQREQDRRDGKFMVDDSDDEDDSQAAANRARDHAEKGRALLTDTAAIINAVNNSVANARGATVTAAAAADAGDSDADDGDYADDDNDDDDDEGPSPMDQYDEDDGFV